MMTFQALLITAALAAYAIAAATVGVVFVLRMIKIL